MDLNRNCSSKDILLSPSKYFLRADTGSGRQEPLQATFGNIWSFTNGRLATVALQWPVTRDRSTATVACNKRPTTVALQRPPSTVTLQWSSAMVISNGRLQRSPATVALQRFLYNGNPATATLLRSLLNGRLATAAVQRSPCNGCLQRSFATVVLKRSPFNGHPATVALPRSPCKVALLRPPTDCLSSTVT